MRGLNQQNQDPEENPPKDTLRVLVVEDDELTRRMLALMLRNTPHSIHFSSNGSEAVQAFLDNEFNCIFMDIQMPVMDGLEATRQIRKAERPGRHVLIYGMSAIVDSAYAECLQAGMDGIIGKPLDIKKFRLLISESIEIKTLSVQPSGIAHVLDTEGAVARLGRDLGSYKLLLDEFLRSLPARLNEISEFCVQDDLPKVAGLAHNLKGLAGNFGAGILMQRSVELENSALGGDREQTAKKIEDLNLCLGDLRQAADKILNGNQ